MKVSKRGRTVSIRFGDSAEDQAAARKMLESERRGRGCKDMKWVAVHAFSQENIVFDVQASSSDSFEEQYKAARKALAELTPDFMDYVLTPAGK